MPAASDSSHGAVASLQRENEALRARVQQLISKVGTSRRYKIDQYNSSLDGAWRGKWRLRHGLRVIGIYESEEAARSHLALHLARSQGRIRAVPRNALTDESSSSVS